MRRRGGVLIRSNLHDCNGIRIHGDRKICCILDGSADGDKSVGVFQRSRGVWLCCDRVQLHIGSLRQTLTSQSHEQRIGPAAVVHGFDDQAFSVWAGSRNRIHRALLPLGGYLGGDLIEELASLGDVVEGAHRRREVALSIVLAEELLDRVAAPGKPGDMVVVDR